MQGRCKYVVEFVDPEFIPRWITGGDRIHMKKIDALINDLTPGEKFVLERIQAKQIKSGDRVRLQRRVKLPRNYGYAEVGALAEVLSVNFSRVIIQVGAGLDARQQPRAVTVEVGREILEKHETTIAGNETSAG